MWPDDEKAAENTCCIVKDFEEVWAHFCPPKPWLPVSTDTNSGFGFPAEAAGRHISPLVINSKARKKRPSTVSLMVPLPMIRPKKLSTQHSSTQ